MFLGIKVVDPQHACITCLTCLAIDRQHAGCLWGSGGWHLVGGLLEGSNGLSRQLLLVQVIQRTSCAMPRAALGPRVQLRSHALAEGRSIQQSV